MSRRLVMMFLGLGIGLEALWLDGHELPVLFSNQAQAAQPVPEPPAPPPQQGGRRRALRRLFPARPDMPVAACYLSYFGLALFALRWWKLADRRRTPRFSLWAVVAAGFWALVLFFLWPGAREAQGVMTLVMAAVIIQLVSPWEPAPQPGARKLRLRYA
jgi:hypothetical protein